MTECLKTIAWSLVVVAAIYPLEWFVPAERGQPILKRLQNLIYMPIIIGFIYFIQPYANKIAAEILQLGSFLPKFVSVPTSGTAIVIFSIFFALIWDIWQYWVHRFQHTNRSLWETHKFHHSETALNASTHARTHVLSHVLFMLLYMPVLLFLGFLSPHWIAAIIMFRFWGYFNHANIRLNLGVLTPIVSGPQWHRIHHSALPEHQNKNFATFFPFIDMVFGTYYRPKPDEYPATGLSDGGAVGFLQDATVEPLRGWFQMLLPRIRRLSSAKQPYGT